MLAWLMVEITMFVVLLVLSVLHESFTVYDLFENMCVRFVMFIRTKGCIYTFV